MGSYASTYRGREEPVSHPGRPNLAVLYRKVVPRDGAGWPKLISDELPAGREADWRCCTVAVQLL